VKRGRVEQAAPGGGRVIVEPGNRVIIRQNNRIVIRRDESQSIQRFAPNAQTRVVGGGVRETVVVRPGGVRIVTEVDANGRLLRRYRRDPGGREIVFIDNRRFYRNVAIGAGVAALGVGIALALSRPVVAIPRDRYIVDYDRASERDIYDTLIAPPVSRLDRAYSLDEIRYSNTLRDYVRRIDLDAVRFESGSFEITPDQYPMLDKLARGMRRAISRNPAEVFLIEGHTDAVGSDEDNLTLSDRRAEAVADVLVREFGIPPENLVTQGYGEQFLKVPNPGPERLNRRVAVRRITTLLGQQGR
jgi:outer membrane protein OmpA-like peptidoglycan-associated protein